MAYAEHRERHKGIRYRGMYKAADGSYRSAGTFSTEERALEVAKEAERRSDEVISGAAGGLDPRIRATAKCRCEGCRQWARDYEGERTRERRAAASVPARRRWEKSRDPDEPYLDKELWDPIWARAVTDSGIPFKSTAYQVRHTYISHLIEGGADPLFVQFQAGHSWASTTATYTTVGQDARNRMLRSALNGERAQHRGHGVRATRSRPADRCVQPRHDVR